jgi:hypothetical protein
MVLAVRGSRSGFLYALAAAACSLVASPAWGTLISGTSAQAFRDAGVTTVGPVNDISTATTFTMGNLRTTANSSGFFATPVPLPQQNFGPVTFTVGDPLSLQFGNATFGNFASTKITPLRNDSIRSFLFEGNYQQGTFGTPFTPNPSVALFTIEFTQTGGAGNFVSTSATLEFTAQPVPEPTTISLLAVAAGTMVMMRARRRSS